MPSLKDLRNRIRSVKQTQKITSAMKLVAAAKLKRAQEQAEAARPFAQRMSAMIANLAASARDLPGAPPLLAGTGKDDVHLIIVATADRGLCGAFNSSIVRAVRRRIIELRAAGKEVRLLVIGRKGRDMLRRDHGRAIVNTVEGVGRRRLEYAETAAIAQQLNDMYTAGEFDVATIVYNRFRSAISQEVTLKQLIPVEPAASAGDGEADGGGPGANGPRALYEFEPDEETMLAELLPRNLAVQVYGALVENAASEQGARMTAMDNATRNAGEMIGSLSLTYNRTRQAMITKELIEIVSGAEAI